MTHLVVLVLGALILIDGDLIVPAFRNYVKRIVWRKYEKEQEDTIRYIYEREKERKRFEHVLNTRYAQYLEHGYNGGVRFRNAKTGKWEYIVPPKRKTTPNMFTVHVDGQEHKVINYSKLNKK